jgi:hypothetical protein
MQAPVGAREPPPSGQRIHDDHVMVRGRRRGHDRVVRAVGRRPGRLPGEDGEKGDPCSRRLGADQGDGLVHSLLLKRRRHPDVVVAGLHDHDRWREAGQPGLRDLAGDRASPADTGPYIARAGNPDDDGVPVQQPGQQDSP